MKVYELSRELNIPNKELLKFIQNLGINAKSHLNMLDKGDIAKIKTALGEKIAETMVSPKTEQKEVKKKWEPDLKRLICIENISRGKLIYVSKRQVGYIVEWPHPGDINYIELEEFINLKNTDRRFITEPWIRIKEDDEIEILKYAGIYKYYQHIIKINEPRDILLSDFQTFKAKFDRLPEGYKNTIAEYAAKLMRSGELDSIKIKEHIEKSLGIDLDWMARDDYRERE